MGRNLYRSRQSAGSGACAWVSIAFLTAAIPAHGQTPGLPQLPQGSPLPRIAPPVLPSVSPAAGAPLLPATGGDVPNVAVRVTSATVERGYADAVPKSDIDASIGGLIGPAVPLPKIDKARLDILSLYRAKGFVLTTVSVKLDGAGRLRFIVTEGRIAEVRLEGEIGAARAQVLRFLNRLTEPDQQPFNSSRVERYLLLARDIPGIALRTVPQPVDGEPGAMILHAQTERAPVSGSISADNRAFHQTGPNQALTGLALNSFTGLGERIELTFYHTFPNSQNFEQISEEFSLARPASESNSTVAMAG